MSERGSDEVSSSEALRVFSDAASADKERIVASFLRLRKGIGWLGLLLPPGVALYVAVARALRMPSPDSIWRPLPSISDYYHSEATTIFVGVLCTIAVFLFAYQGYSRRPHEKLSDNFVANTAAAFALGVAFFPTTNGCKEVDVWGGLHLACAAGLFACFILFSIVLFTRRGAKADWKATKLPASNRIHVLCGIVMVLAISSIGIYKLRLHLLDECDDGWFVFLAEWIALWAFSVSWLVKGRSLERPLKWIERVGPNFADSICLAVLKRWQKSDHE